jgi:hypothetical protein
MADEVKMRQDTYITENLILKILLLVFRKYNKNRFAQSHGLPWETKVYKLREIYINYSYLYTCIHIF